MTRRRRALLLSPLFAALLLPVGSPPAAAAKELSYSVGEARAYVYRVALRKEVIEAARNADPCDPQEDPYGCDDAAYDHRPNCPGPIELGREERAPRPAREQGTEEIAGRAGDASGVEQEPPLSSAITLNELLSLGTLVRTGTGNIEASGLASDSYVDLSGRQEPSLHTESDAFTPNRRDWEERCLQEERGSPSYRHFLSRSFDRPETYHLAECFKDDCTFDRLMFFAQAVEARTVVHLVERGGKIHGSVKSNLQELSWGDGAFTLDQLDTHVSFVSDGTRGGLRWSVATTAKGARLDGRPVALPPGRVVGSPELQVGVTAPYVSAAQDGGALRIVAPGLMIASPEQTAYFAGAELEAGGIGRWGGGFVPERGGDVPPAGGDTTTAPTVASGDAVTTAPAAPAAAPSGEAATPEVAAETASVSIQRIGSTGLAPLVTILALGLGGVLAIFLHWMGRFPWWRQALRTQPLRGIDWIYRAFLKT